MLFERGLSDLDPRDFRDLRSELTEEELEQQLSISMADHEIQHFAMKSMLEEARDMMGEILVRSWTDLTPDTLDYREAALAMITAAEAGRVSRFAASVADNFTWRGIL